VEVLGVTDTLPRQLPRCAMSRRVYSAAPAVRLGRCPMPRCVTVRCTGISSDPPRPLHISPLQGSGW
jgi:hypothetical protein